MGSLRLGGMGTARSRAAVPLAVALPARRLGSDEEHLHLVAVEGGAAEASRDEKFGAFALAIARQGCGMVRNEKGALALAVAGKLDGADEGGRLVAAALGNEAVTGLAAALDFTELLQFGESVAVKTALIGAHSQSLGQLGFVERLVVYPRELFPDAGDEGILQK